MAHARLLCLAACWLAVLLLAAVPVARAQAAGFDASWYEADRPFVKLSVVEDGIYRVTGRDLEAAGVSLDAVPTAGLRLLEDGIEVPLHLTRTGGSLRPDDALLFVGRRNRGTDEAWAYENGNPAFQSSPYRSLFTDTTTYWLTWGDGDGLRYETASGGAGGGSVTSVRDTLHLERDERYYYGDSQLDVGSPLYTRGEGYYWDLFAHSSDAPVRNTYALELPRLDASASEPVRITVRLNGGTAAQHRVTMEIDGGSGFALADEAEWEGRAFRTLSATVPARTVAGGTLQVRVTSTNDFGSSTPNQVLLDYVEAAYTRRLQPAANGQQHFAPAGSTPQTFALTGYAGSAPVQVLSPATGRRFAPTPTAGTATFTDTPGPEASYWATRTDDALRPVRIERDVPSDWAAASNAADYVVLTTRALEPSARELAAFRSAQDGFSVAVVLLRDVYDQFGYGRATPRAIRRFVHRSQAWATPPRFLAIWADAAYPVRTDTEEPDGPWNVPAFGYAPSDSWYAMQYDGPDDWSEMLAVGRLPVRTNAEGRLLLQKLQRYEQVPVEAWQKRMLLLTGGATASEQRQLLSYTTRWGTVAGSPPPGMDTLYFSKRSDRPLDTSFQDSLNVAFASGASWLNYFGHSAAQTWEIVTAPPAEFDNAGRLPFVVSLGCQTGSFAGGRFTTKTRPSFGEQLLLGYGEDGQPSLNGAIAHFGTSYLGSVNASAVINDALVEEVYTDTARVMGPAIRRAKAAVAAGYAQSTLYRDHLLQYQLLGDPALTLALARKPDLHLEPSQLLVTPTAPKASDELTLEVRVTNHGLAPAVPVPLAVLWRSPTGRQRTFDETLPPFGVADTARFTALLSGEDVGANVFRAGVDPADAIDEATETDNVAERTQVVFATGVAIVSPHDQGLAPSRQPTLRFTVAPTTPLEATVVLQLFDNGTFEAPVAETERRADQLAIDWQPQSTLEAGRTYHWRARVVDAGEATPWQTGTFTVRPEADADGWLQQGALFATNTPKRLRYDGTWTFETYGLDVLATAERGSGTFKGRFTVGGAQNYESLTLGFGVLHMDGQTGKVERSASFCTYPLTRPDLLEDGCTGGVDGAAAVDQLRTFVDQVDTGDYLFVRTRHLARAGSAEIPAAVASIFRTLVGAGGPYSAAIDTLTYDDLWLMQARKGAPGETVERVADKDNGENEITYQTRLSFQYADGTTTTPRIGPAQSWDRLEWRADRTGTDALRLDVLAEDGSVLLDDVADASRGLGDLDAATHPYLRLRATLADDAQRTPPQLIRWQVTYRQTAELAADARRLDLSTDAPDEGEPVEIAFPVVNIGMTAAADVRVEYTVTDAQNRTRTVAVDELGTIAPDQEVATQATVATEGLAGANTVAAHVTAARPEYIASNNTIVQPLAVGADETPPEVRVLVDGRPIPSDPAPLVNLQDPGLPFVAARPTVEIEIEDADAVTPLARAELVEVYLDCDPTDPTTTCTSVPASDTTFHPADAPGEAARVFYEPDFSGQDTTHTLRVVVRDEAGNVAGGQISYQAHLRVQSALAVRDLYPFPNPMSRHTHFAFQLKGADASQVTEMRLRIYTLSGTLVREFDVLENPMLLDAGALRVGWNKIYWDGTDADGDRVATGVYLYKVFMDTTEGTIDVNGGRVEKIAVIR